MARLEHVNVTVADPDALAKTLCEIFDWKVRWSGAAMGNGRSVHVGDGSSYVALYAPGETKPFSPDTYARHGGLNHIGVVVDDLDATETRVMEAGFSPTNHADYEPGRRFYFSEADGIEIEVVCYARVEAPA